jgi:hypothetical protein
MMKAFPSHPPLIIHSSGSLTGIRIDADSNGTVKLNTPKNYYHFEVQGEVE